MNDLRMIFCIWLLRIVVAVCPKQDLDGRELLICLRDWAARMTRTP